MGFFSKLFASVTGTANQTARNAASEQTPDTSSPQHLIQFGRFSDSYKDESQYEAWDKSLKLFDEQQYIESYKAFFEYVNALKDNSFTYTEENGGLQFRFVQGSKIVYGAVDGKKITAEAKILKCNVLNVGFMRILAEQNFGLKYTRYSLDEENNICIRFNSHLVDCNPYKFYYGLKELATNADKKDDQLAEEFKDVFSPIHTEHIQDVPDTEKQVKYTYTQQWLKEAIDAEPVLAAKKLDGAAAYRLLATTYKLDYLLSPEGAVMDTLERVHTSYFAKDTRDAPRRNADMIKELQTIQNRSLEELGKSMYLVTCTFGIVQPVGHDRIVATIDSEMANYAWYANNGYPEVALDIPTYIVGYILYNYAPLLPVRELLHLYYEIVEAGFFKDLGYKQTYYNPSTQQLDANAIKIEIQNIQNENKTRFSEFQVDTSVLKFDSIHEFAYSFMILLRSCLPIPQQQPAQ